MRGHERHLFKTAQLAQTPYPSWSVLGLHVPPEIVSNHSSPGTRLEAPDLLLDTVFKEAKIPGCESLNFRHVAVLRQIQLRGGQFEESNHQGASARHFLLESLWHPRGVVNEYGNQNHVGRYGEAYVGPRGPGAWGLCDCVEACYTEQPRDS